MSAFYLKLNDIPLENVFQDSKKYELGRHYIDILTLTPKEAKQDERHRHSGYIIAFSLNGEE